MKKKLIVLVGPTASGKTDIAEILAKKYPLDIISADSRQIYKFMDIGTGKPLNKEFHGLVDFLDPKKDFSAAEYKKKAEALIKKSYENSRIPFLVGGSGLYIKAVIDGLCDAPSADYKIRQKLAAEAKKAGIGTLYEKLEIVDPKAAKKIHPNDLRRIIRALEVYYQTGKPFSSFQRSTEDPGYSVLIVGIRYPLEELYGKIDKRIDTMLKQGFIKEVEALLKKGYNCDLRSMQSLGYKEITEYLAGKYDLDTAIELMKKNTRHYARRQMIWFRKDKRIEWIDVRKTSIACIAGKTGKILDNFLKITYNKKNPEI